MRPKQAAEFSFLLGLPTLGGACAYKLLRNITEDGGSMLDLGVTPLLAGIVAATISAALAIKWLVGFLGHHGVALFGWYRIALCVVIGALWWTGAVSF